MAPIAADVHVCTRCKTPYFRDRRGLATCRCPDIRTQVVKRFCSACGVPYYFSPNHPVELSCLCGRVLTAEAWPERSREAGDLRAYIGRCNRARAILKNWLGSAADRMPGPDVRAAIAALDGEGEER